MPHPLSPATMPPKYSHRKITLPRVVFHHTHLRHLGAFALLKELSSLIGISLSLFIYQCL